MNFLKPLASEKSLSSIIAITVNNIIIVIINTIINSIIMRLTVEPVEAPGDQSGSSFAFDSINFAQIRLVVMTVMKMMIMVMVMMLMMVMVRMMMMIQM